MGRLKNNLKPFHFYLVQCLPMSSTLITFYSKKLLKK